MKVSYVLSSLVKPFLPCLANCRLRCLDSGYCHVCSPGKYLCFFCEFKWCQKPYDAICCFSLSAQMEGSLHAFDHMTVFSLDLVLWKQSCVKVRWDWNWLWRTQMRKYQSKSSWCWQCCFVQRSNELLPVIWSCLMFLHYEYLTYYMYVFTWSLLAQVQTINDQDGKTLASMVAPFTGLEVDGEKISKRVPFSILYFLWI